jgi:hypothetical protein
MSIVHEKGDSNFGGPSGVTITHNLNLADYIPDVIPIEDSVAVGRIWITDIAVNSFVVRNTGSSVSAFKWSTHKR